MVYSCRAENEEGLMAKSQRKFVLAACAWLPSLSGEDTPSRVQGIWLCAPNPLLLLLPVLLWMEIMPAKRDVHGWGCAGIELWQVGERNWKKNTGGEGMIRGLWLDLGARRALAPALWKVLGIEVCGSIILPGFLHPSAEGLLASCSLRWWFNAKRSLKGK